MNILTIWLALCCQESPPHKNILCSASNQDAGAGLSSFHSFSGILIGCLLHYSHCFGQLKCITEQNRLKKIALRAYTNSITNNKLHSKVEVSVTEGKEMEKGTLNHTHQYVRGRGKVTTLNQMVKVGCLGEDGIYARIWKRSGWLCEYLRKVLFGWRDIWRKGFIAGAYLECLNHIKEKM